MKTLPTTNHLKIEIIHIKQRLEPDFYALRVYDPNSNSVLVYEDERGTGAIRCFSDNDLLAHLTYAISALPPLEAQSQQE